MIILCFFVKRFPGGFWHGGPNIEDVRPIMMTTWSRFTQLPATRLTATSSINPGECCSDGLSSTEKIRSSSELGTGIWQFQAYSAVLKQDSVSLRKTCEPNWKREYKNELKLANYTDSFHNHFN